jgi:Zn-dependent peptidase ImmA (M78 family)
VKISRAQKEAERLIKLYDLEPPIDARALAERLGINVQIRPFEDNLSGLVIAANEEAVIGVNSNHARVRQRFTIAHEIGHFVLHRSEKTFFVDEASIFFRESHSPAEAALEREANAFAAALLMPETAVRELAGDYVDIHDEAAIRRLAREFAVSPQALMIRLSNLQLAF